MLRSAGGGCGNRDRRVGAPGHRPASATERGAVEGPGGVSGPVGARGYDYSYRGRENVQAEKEVALLKGDGYLML
jgi:hypothetical protein